MSAQGEPQLPLRFPSVRQDVCPDGVPPLLFTGEERGRPVEEVPEVAQARGRTSGVALGV